MDTTQNSQVDRTSNQTQLQRILNFFVTKIIIGSGFIILLVVSIEWLRSTLLDKTSLSDNIKALIVAIAEAFIAVIGYIFIFRLYEKRRQIHELSAGLLINNASIGFLSGVLLQSLFILFIYLGGTFLVMSLNSSSALVQPFAFALTAGFVAEIILIGVLFRLLEQQIGTVLSLIAFIMLFGILHVNVKGATSISIGATAMQAGLLLPASYVFSRNLWLPIFLHFGWDFAEPGIFGGINPSTSLTGGLLTSKIAGNPLLTGGPTGPQNSLSSLVVCLVLGLILLFLAKRKNNLKSPYWRTT
jgi:CAAX protease family protein